VGINFAPEIKKQGKRAHLSFYFVYLLAETHKTYFIVKTR